MGLGGFVVDATILGLIALWLVTVVPAAIVTMLKRRWAIFFAGWVTFGLAWYFGAIPLSSPEDRWAQRFYDERKMARAADPAHNARPRRTIVAWVGGTLALFVVLGSFAARPSPVLGVDGRTLEFSVEPDLILGSMSDECDRVGAGTWTCYAWDSSVSGDIPYRVEMRRFGCWTATRKADYGGGDSPKRFSECITLVDHVLK